MQLLTHTGGVILNARLIVDGQDRQAFGRSADAYLRKRINEQVPETLRQVSFADSISNPLIQLADMCAGAINRNAQRVGVTTNHANILLKKQFPRVAEDFGTLNKATRQPSRLLRRHAHHTVTIRLPGLL